MKTLETQVTVFETNYYTHKMYSTAQVRIDNMLKTKTQSRKQVYQASLNQTPQNPIKQTQQDKPTHGQNTI